jgi:RHS repeat-associated protein
MKLRMLFASVSMLLLAFGTHVRGDMNIVTLDHRSNIDTPDCDKHDQAGGCQCETIGVTVGEAKVDLDCARVKISTGPMRPGTELGPGFFKLQVVKPTPESATVGALRYVLGYSMYRSSREETSAGLPRYLSVLNENGISIGFRFADGESLGVPFFGSQSLLTHRILMVDAEGWATTNNPAYYDLYPGDGAMYRFIAATNSPDYLALSLYRGKTGREETMSTVDTEVIKDDAGNIRQVLAPSCLADVVTSSAYKYSISLYHRSQVQAEKDGNGLYAPQPGAPVLAQWTIENPDPSSVNRLKVTQVKGSYSNVSDYVYNDAAEEWTLTQGAGLKTISKDMAWNDNRTVFLETRIVKGADAAVLGKSTTKFTKINGAFRITEEVNDPDGEADKTTYTRFTAAGDGKKLGFVKSMVRSDGNWTSFDYDANGYKTQEISGWKDSPLNSTTNQAVYYSYAPVAPNDAPAYNDQRPRTVTRKINGQTVAKTFHAYTTNAVKELTEIEEMCTDPSASYGDAGSLRTTKVYYGTKVAGQMIGRLKSVQLPDGTLETHTYEYGNYTTSTNASQCAFTADPDGLAWRQTVTHGTINAPAGIANKTTRETSILDEYGRAVMTEAYVYNGMGYDRVSWTVNTMDNLNHLTKTEKSDGTIFTQSWGSNCCGVESQKDASGIEQVFAYDLLNQRISETKKGTNSPNDDITQSYVLDALGRHLKTTISGGGISLVTSSNAYNTAGHLTQSTDAQGITTTYEQGCCGLESSTIRAGLTNTTVRHADGRTHYTQQNGTRQQTFVYGINSDGTQWTQVYTGPEGTNSAAWQKSTSDFLGRTVMTERPGFGEVIITNETFYNPIGQVVKTTSSGRPDTLSEYNVLGEQTRSGTDVDGDGTLDIGEMDRVSESDRFFEQDGSGDWWQVSVAKFYPNDNDATVVTNSSQRQRLTGLGTAKTVTVDGTVYTGVLTAQSLSQDFLGNTSTSYTVIDRDNKTVVQGSTSPDSVNDQYQVTINGLATKSVSKTGLVMTYGYDALGRRIATTDPRTGTSITHYNTKGQVDWVEDAATNRTTFAYDPATGQRISTTDALTNTTHQAYSEEGQLIATWGATYPVYYEYDAYDRMSAMYTYRGTNEISAFQDFSLSAFDKTSWFYDPATGLLTNKLYSDGNGTAYTYTPDGKLATRAWARGVVTTYSYDTCCGALTNITYSDNTPSVSYTYDRLGRQVTITDAQGTRTNVYDAATLALVEEQLPDGTVLERSQDPFGRASGISVATGTEPVDYAVTYGYDTVGRFHSVSSSVSSVSSVVNYSYLPDSSMISGYTAGDLTVSRSYEPNRNLITGINNQWGTNLVSSFTYDNDAVGRRTKRVDNASITNSFDYNIRSEVIEALMGTNTYGYAYDPIGNRLSEVRDLMSEVSTNLYTANALNQYSVISNFSSQVSSLIPQYDADGNMVSYNGWTFTWNGENRLIAASNATTVVENAYDYMGRRIIKTTKNQAQGTTNQTQFVYDGWNLIAENDGSTTNHYVWGLDLSGSMQGAGGIGGLLATIEDGEAYFNCFDANGNLSDYVDTNGAIVAHYEYDAFGQTTVKTGTLADANPYRFSTKYLDEKPNLYYYGYRYYSPETGRWVNRDPIEEYGGVHLYGFLRNSPELAIDYLGMGVFYWRFWPWNWFGGYDVDNKHVIPPFVPDPESINCLGFATGQDAFIRPFPGSKASLKDVLIALGYECTEGISAENCKEHCGTECNDYVMLYAYLQKEFRDHWDEIRKRFKEKGIHWLDSPFRLCGSGVDFHALKGRDDGKYEYQPCGCSKGDPNDKRDDPGVYPKEGHRFPDYFPADQILGKACCCKKDES